MHDGKGLQLQVLRMVAARVEAWRVCVGLPRPCQQSVVVWSNGRSCVNESLTRQFNLAAI